MPPQTPASLAKSWLMTWGPQFAVKLFLSTAREDFVFRRISHEKTPFHENLPITFRVFWLANWFVAQKWRANKSI